MNDNDYVECDCIFKLLIVGDSGVGKSCVLVRFVDDEFDEDTPCTIGVDFKIKILEDFQGKKINLTIWDTAGQEKFRSLTSSYYRGTNGIVLVFDVTDQESFENLDMWIQEIEMYTRSTEPAKLLIGNKIDREGERQVSTEQATEYARNKGMVYIETSAKTKVGIQQAFEELVQKIMDMTDAMPKADGGVDLNGKKASEKSDGCGC